MKRIEVETLEHLSSLYWKKYIKERYKALFDDPGRKDEPRMSEEELDKCAEYVKREILLGEGLELWPEINRVIDQATEKYMEGK